MANVYLVTTGSYSDYSVLAAFSTREAAEAFEKVVHTSESGIEEFPLDAPPSEWYGYNVQMCRDGRVRHAYPFGPTAWSREASEIKERFLLENEMQPDGSVARVKTREEWLDHTVYTRDEEQAIKATNELRSRLIAENRWRVGPVE